jgi:membrane protein required for colicin V production
LNLIDIIIIIFLLAGFILGFKDGLVRKIIGLAGFCLAIFLAVKYSSDLGKIIESVFNIEFYFSEIIAGFVIFLLIVSIFAVIKRIVHPFDKVNNLINQLLGGFVGFVQILFFLSAALYLLNIFSLPNKEAKKNSFLYYGVFAVLPKTIDYLKEYAPNSKKIIKKYIQDKDSI